MSWKDEVEEIAARRQRALLLGGEERIARQHGAGRLTVRERLEALLDPGSFVEIGMLAGDKSETGFSPSGYVAGLGRVGGRDIAIGGEDFTIRGGSEREGHSKLVLLCKMAREYRIPAIFMHDGAGGSLEMMIRKGYATLPSGHDWSFDIDLMAEVPVVATILGSVAGGPAGRSMLSHFSCMVKGTSELFAGGPPLVKRAIGVDVTKQELGGSHIHVHANGIVDNEAADELDCLRQAKRFLSYMPQNVWEAPPYQAPTDRPDRREEALLGIIPRNRRQAYDMRKLIRLVVDDQDYFELKPFYGKGVVTVLARLNGHVVGILGHNPMFQGGALDGPGADKQSQFMELCDHFHIPVIFFVDVPGFMIGPQAERSGALRRGMRSLWTTYQITVPLLQIVVRRCYGIAGVTSGNARRLNLRLAWPSGEWGALPIEGGVDAAFRRVIEAAPDPAAKRNEIEESLHRMRSPFPTAEAFAVEDIIDPRDTRPLLIRFLETTLPARNQTLGPKTRSGMRP